MPVTSSYRMRVRPDLRARARLVVWLALTPEQRRDPGVLYALSWSCASDDDLIVRIHRGQPAACAEFARLVREYRRVVAPGRSADGLPPWEPPAWLRDLAEA